MSRSRISLGSTFLLVLVGGAGLAGPAQETYLVRGTDMGPYHNHVSVYGPDGAVSDAVVTANGTPLIWNGSRYSANLDTEVPAGDTLTLTVEIGDITIIAKDAVPIAPLITGPADNAEFGPLDPVLVTWESATDPDVFLVDTYCPDDCNPEPEWEVPGDRRSFEIPAGSLEFNEVVRIRVYAYNDGMFTGPTDPTSEMNIRASRSPQPEITVVDLTATEKTSWGFLKSRYQ